MILSCNKLFDLIEAYDQFTGFPIKPREEKKEERLNIPVKAGSKIINPSSATQKRACDYNRVNLNDFETQYQEENNITQFVTSALGDKEKDKEEEDRDDFYGKKFLKHLDDNHVEKLPMSVANPLTAYESKFISVSELSAINPRPSPNERLNVLGVVHQLGNVRMIDKTNKLRLNIEIVDPCSKPFRSIVLCIWEKSSGAET